MRNIFDFYSQAENQLTHALFSTLKNEPKLLGDFIKKFCGARGLKTTDLRLSVQRYPFARAYTDEEITDRSIPDAWIYTDDFALVFEAKITASVDRAQLASHVATARKQGFETAQFFTITADPNAPSVQGWQNIRWCDIYTWLREHEHAHPFAGQAANYFELLEARMSENNQLDNGNLTTFTGFPNYEDGYSYSVAKNTLKKAMDELRKDRDLANYLSMNPNSGRDKITGKNETVVWDFLSMGKMKEDEKTKKATVHLTLGINDRNVEATITIPNNLETYQRNKIKGLGMERFTEICQEILENMKPILKENPGAQPILRGLQRRYYPSQSSYPTMDTIIETDLRTAFHGYNKREHPRLQEQWLRVIYNVFCNKNSNYQMQIGVYFSYKKCKNVHKANATNLIKNSWLACKPLIDEL